MRIQTNIPAICAYNQYRRTNTDTAKTLEKLSSGFRINRASDDASGLAISEKMRRKITELDRCQQNVAEGVNIVKTADAALDEVNEMLIRAHQLCVEAANGTYGQQELDAVGDEINALFTEIDRITEGSSFNKIPLFRNAVPASHIERREAFDPLPAGQIETWGGIDFIQGLQKFDPGEKAEGAKATFTLKDDIDLTDKMSLDGKAVTLTTKEGRTYTYYFDGGNYDNIHVSGYSVRIDLKSSEITDVKSALEQMAKSTSYSNILSDVKVDPDTKAVTLTAKAGDYIQTLVADGKNQILSVKDGDGTKYQNATVSGPDGKLSFGTISEPPETYGSTATATFDFSFLPSTINGDTFNNLKQNKLYIDGKEIKLSAVVGSSTSISRSSLLSKLVTEIKKTARYNNSGTKVSGNSIIITATGLSTSSPANICVYETKTPASGGTRDDYKTVLTGSNPGITVTETQPITGERGAVFEIKVPTGNMPQSGSDKAISFQINGNAYFLYDTTVNSDAKLQEKHPDHTDGMQKTVYINGIQKTVTPKNISGMTQEQVRDFITGEIKRIYGGMSGYTCTVNGDTVTIQEPRGVSSKPDIGYCTAVVELKKNGQAATGGSDYVLARAVGDSSSPEYLQQDAIYTITLPSDNAAGVKSLADKSFEISKPIGSNAITTRGIMFYDSTAGTLSAPSGYDLIDIKGITSVSALRAAINKTELNTVVGFKAEGSGSKITLTVKKDTNGRDLDWDSGYHELKSIVADTTPAKFAGGTLTGHDHTSIDFSSITDDNMESLLGKGFRVNCATCSGEYINVVFCWENEGNRMPESFQVFDKDSNEMRTIHNVAVELSKVKSASSIVQDIVDQVKGKLNHYTALSVDPDNPLILLAQDRRMGDVYNGLPTPANRVYGSVEGGLKTNFTYSVADVKVRDFPPDGSVYLQDGGVDIYVGSDPDPSLIHLHLPYIDLETLRLGKPGEVDLNDPEQNASSWIGRIDTANNAISKARGILGADQNRLEHTANALACEDENLTAAESRIRDADVAELMMNYTKLQIQIQAQQSMLAQANQQPQGVLQLLG